MSTPYLEHVRERLEASGPLVARRMFGGWGLYRAGLFFALIAEDRLYFKVDDESRGDFERAGAEPFRPFGDERVSKSYFEVPEAVLGDSRRLAEWSKRALAAAERASAAKRSSRRRTRSSTRRSRRSSG